MRKTQCVVMQPQGFDVGSAFALHMCVRLVIGMNVIFCGIFSMCKLR